MDGLQRCPQTPGLCTGLIRWCDWERRGEDKQREKNLLAAPSHAASCLGELDLCLWFSLKTRVTLGSRQSSFSDMPQLLSEVQLQELEERS